MIKPVALLIQAFVIKMKHFHRFVFATNDIIGSSASTRRETYLLVPIAIPIGIGFDVEFDGPLLPYLGLLGHEAGDGSQLLRRLQHRRRVDFYTR